MIVNLMNTNSKVEFLVAAELKQHYYYFLIVKVPF